MPEDLPLVMVNIARNYRKLDKSKLSEQISLEALQAAEKFKIPQYIRLVSLNLKLIYIQRKDFANALRYDSLYFQSKESVLSQKVQVQLQDFNSRLESERQTAFANKLILEKKLAESKFFYLLFSALLLFVLLLVITGFLVQRHLQRNRIKQVVKQLDQSNLFLKRFISILAHDLRSPFNTILGYSDMLKNDPDMSEEDTEVAKEALCRVSNSTFQLLERLLEWSRLQTGTLKPEKKSADLLEIIHEVIRLHEPAASLKNIKLEVNSAGPVITAVDPDMIHTTIRNLISNAIKFSHRGGLVRITLQRNDKEIQIEINDTGVGITDENLTKIFAPHEHFTSYGTAGEKGTGLGLTLCQEYIRLHRGVIRATSKVGSGSTFYIILPVEDSEK
jgi:signal transduction histidine kinase